MWFHAMTGREGMINTANKTASSGYIQRSCVKLNEDLKIEYDGTVRDACGNIHQFVYGNHGFNASSVSFDSNGPTPIDIQRLACRLKGRSDAKPLDLSEINDIVDACKWNREIPLCIYDSVAKPREQHLRSQLELVKVCADRYVEFKKRIVDAYHTSRAVPGDCVGIVSAQSIGEVQTQSNLNTFHTAGKLQSSGVDHFEEILNVSKSVKCPSMRIYFNRTFESISELRNTVGCSIVGMTLGQIVRPITSVAEYTIETGFEIHISFSLKRSILHAIRLSPDIICEAIESAFCDCECEITSPFELTVKILSPVQIIKNQLVSALKRVHVCGIDGISAMYVEKDDTTNEFLIVTDGSNLKRVLCHDLVDVKRVSTNNIIETFDCLGIAATRRMLLNNIKSVVSGVNSCHIELLVDKMTFKGRPSSITRYTMKTNAVGPLSKATFEQSVDILLDAAFKGERDPINGVSAAIITGNRVRIGTGMPELLIDFERINKDHTVSYYD
jgi:DNA-directed RNA polymerase beta' subunit